LLRQSWGTISLGCVTMRLISSRSWRWSFSWRFQHSPAPAFRSCVARHLCLQNFHRPSTKYMFFVGDVIVHLRLGLATKYIQKLKWKLGFRKNLDLFFFVLRMIKIKRWKRKIKRKTENIHKRNTRLNIDYLFPGNSARKRALTVKICIKFRLDSQAYKSTVVDKGPFFP
jgi:hypothetical protein